MRRKVNKAGWLTKPLKRRRMLLTFSCHIRNSVGIRQEKKKSPLDSKERIKNMSHKAHVRHDSARHKQEELKLLEVIHICRISRCLLWCCDETNDEKNILQIKGVFCQLSYDIHVPWNSDGDYLYAKCVSNV